MLFNNKKNSKSSGKKEKHYVNDSDEQIKIENQNNHQDYYILIRENDKDKQKISEKKNKLLD